MWVPFDTFNEIKGRIRGVSLPYPNGQVLVLTDRGLFAIWYFRSAFVNQLASTAEAQEYFDHSTGTLTWDGNAYPMLGPCAPGNDPRHHSRHPNGERAAVEADAVHILDAGGTAQQTIDVNAPDGWAVAAFSVDGKALVVADGLSVLVFRYETSAGAERPRWAAVAAADEQKRLLQTIIDSPDEDTPRLAYADWLDEHDDPTRAEFVRLQCRLAERAAREAVPADDPDRRREHQLVTQLGERWLAELPTIRGVKWSGFWRGFAGISVSSATTLVSAAPKIWAAAPVEWATVTGLNLAGAKRLATSDALSRLRVFSLEGYYLQREGEKPLRTLFHSPRVSSLKRLYLPSGIGESGVSAVAQSPHLTGLEWLSVGSGGLTDDAADALVGAAWLLNLRGGSFVSYRLSGAARARLKARFPAAVV